MSESRLDGPVEPEQARVMLGKGEAVAIDLRSPEEISEARAPGAIWVEDDDPVAAAEKARGEREVPVIVFAEDEESCRNAIERLGEAGIEAAPLEGGWKAWISEDKPVQPKREDIKGPDLSKVPGS